MKSMKYKAWTLASVAVVVLCCWGAGASSQTPAEPDGPHQHSHTQHDHTHIADTNYEISFLVDDGNGIEVGVRCLSGPYSVSFDNSTPEGERMIKFKGTLQPQGERCLLEFDALLHQANAGEGADVTFSAAGNTLMKIGQEVTLLKTPGPAIKCTVRQLD